jgi:3-phenylpropionate/cinnamic acid dioxygenase small subunit
MKRLIKTRKNIAPYNVYQVEDGFITCLNDIELFKTKHQHLATSFCETELARQRNLKNQRIIESLNQLRADGII